MTDDNKARIIMALIGVTPARDSKTSFQEMAARNDLNEIRQYFENSLKTQSHRDDEIEKQGKVSFRMIVPIIRIVLEDSTD